MGCTTQQSSYRISAANVKWGRKEKTCIDTDTGLGLTGGEYFLLSSVDTNYYVWIDVDNGSVDPAIAGRTGIEVDVASGYSASDLASALKSAIEAASNLLVTVKDSGTCACIEDMELGAPLSAIADGDTGMTITQSVAGIGGYLGKTSGGIEIAVENNSTEILSDQGGSIPEDIINQGTNVTVTMSLLEMTKEKWQLLIGEGVGDNYTPAGGTQVTGYGTNKNYQSLLDLSGCLLIEPIDRPNRDEDLLFWKAIPIPSSFSFSGTDPIATEFTFNTFSDDSKASEVDIMVCGDVSQDFRLV